MLVLAALVAGVLRASATLPFAQVLPQSVLIGETHTLQVFFKTGSAVSAQGAVEVEAPSGFSLSGCALDLPEWIYRNGDTPSIVSTERLPLVQGCTLLASPPRVQVSLRRPLQEATSYAFGLTVDNPLTQNAQEDQLLWMVRTYNESMVLVDESDGGAAWLDAIPGTDAGRAWGLASQALAAPQLRWGELLPFFFTTNTAYVTVFPLEIPFSLSLPMRLVAPLGWTWEPGIVESGFWQDFIPAASTSALPGALPSVHSEIFLCWNEPLGFVAGERYGFRVPVRVPQWPSTGFDFFLELGYWNQSVGSGLRPFAVVLPGPTPSMIRTPLVDYLTGRVSEEQAVRVRLTTTSPIFSGGGFVFQGGVATRRLQCTCQSVQVGWSCAVGQRPTGELLVTVVVDRALPGTHSVLLACSNPPNAYAAGSWTIGSYQDPLNYPDATQVDAPATAAGFPMQASLEYFERLPRNDTSGFDPRPLRNSSTLLAFRLPQPASLVRLRAPEGSRFQIRCLDQIFTDLSQVFPEAVPQGNFTQLPELFSCEGFPGHAILKWEAPLASNETFVMRVVATNPEVDPIWNVWTLEVDGFSSSKVPAIKVHTFSGVQVDLAAASSRVGSTVGGVLGNSLRLRFTASVNAEAVRVTAPSGFDFGLGTQCAGIRFVGRRGGAAPFVQPLASCQAQGNVLDIFFKMPLGMSATASYTLDADVLTPSEPGESGTFQLSSTELGGGLGDDVTFSGPLLTNSPVQFEVNRVGSTAPRSGLGFEVDLAVAFNGTAQAGDRIRLTLPPRFLFKTTETNCPVNVLSPSGSTPECYCQGVVSCSVTLTVGVAAEGGNTTSSAPSTTASAWDTCSSILDPAPPMEGPWPCGSLLVLRIVAVYPQAVPVAFENMWLAEVLRASVAAASLSGVHRGWFFNTAMASPQVSLGGSATRAGAADGVLIVSFVPANAAQKLMITASAPSGWDFQAAEVCLTSEVTACETPTVSSTAPEVLLLENQDIKAQVPFRREIRTVKLAQGGGLTSFNLVTYTVGQLGDEVAADSSGTLVQWRLPGALEVQNLDVALYRTLFQDGGDAIFQQLPPRLMTRETVLTLDFTVSQACVAGDIITLDDPTGTFEMFQDQVTLKRVGDGFVLDYPITAVAIGRNTLQVTADGMIVAGAAHRLQLNVRLRQELVQFTGAASRKFLNFFVQRSGEPLPINTNDELINSSFMQENWSSSVLLNLTLNAQVGAPSTQIQVAGEIRLLTGQATEVLLVAPVGVAFVLPCRPTACGNLTEDFGGTRRQALALAPGSFALAVDLPNDWDAGTRNDWVAMVPNAETFSSKGALMWDSANSVTLRAMPASVLYASVAQTRGVDLSVQLTVGAAALALLGPAKSSVLVSAPGSYVLHCDGFRGSVPATCQAQGSQAVLALDVNLAGSASLFFSFTLDTPEADPYPNTFLIALRDVQNITLDANVAVPGMHIPQTRVVSSVKIVVVGFENLAWLQAWGDAAQQLGVLSRSVAGVLSIGAQGVAVDSVVAALGTGRRLQSGQTTGHLEVNFSAYSSLVPVGELSDRVTAVGFRVSLQEGLTAEALAAGLASLQVLAVSEPDVPSTTQPPNVTTPTLRWTSSVANSTGTVSVNLIFQQSTDALRAVLIQMPAGYIHRLEAVEDVVIVQRGATSRFPIATAKDGSAVQTRAADSIRVLLGAGATVAEGGYGFEIPISMPMTDPIQNIWTVSLCSGIYCNGPRDSSVVTSFAIAGFHIGDRPTLLRPRLVSGGRTGRLGLLALISILMV